MSTSEKYVKLSQLEHILKRPDTYIGSIEPSKETMWIIDSENKLVQKEITYVPALLKIFDEILVNAADNKIRDPSMKKMEVTIDAESNSISVKNDGRGIPIEIHKTEKIYVPELIFGHLLTSSNYDDNEKKITGGRNGYGAKLCNIFSTKFELETSDKNTQQCYTQLWENNMGTCNKPKITKFIKKNGEFTKISFQPDLAKFGMTQLDEDMLGLLKRRVYDIAGCCKGVNVFLNGEKIVLKDFKAYVQMYLESVRNKRIAEGTESAEEPPAPIIYEKNDRWEVAFSLSESSFSQVSFVNSIATTSGGTHVNYIADQIVNKTLEHLKKKHKNTQVRPFQIRNNMFLFVNSAIENPAFTSQTKEQMITKVSAFGSKFTVSDDFIKKVTASKFIQQILDIAQANADKLLKKTDGTGRKNRVIVPKLEDANKAGTRESEKCTLILTEGDSAKSLAVSGLKIVGRDYYGVFPLRGKLLNVRDASSDQIMKNQEIKNLKQIIGLQHKKKYDSVKGLRYGHLMIMTDQDYDGFHIKGLIINFIEQSFPGLLNIPGFLLEFMTPIVKVTIKKNREELRFYSMQAFENWKETEGKKVTFSQKYYKGLGTSTSKDMNYCFSDLDTHIKSFDTLKDNDQNLIELAFSKKRADDRKNWLANYEMGTHLDPEIKLVPYDDFINKELILFSMADNIRSIPSMLDGFKPAQRKVLYTFFSKNIKKEVKVSDLQGYVSSSTEYHHGDTSMIQTIVGLAQDFVGSNNINLLEPNGAFGTRDSGGKDSAAGRYIFTELNKLTKFIFREEDSNLLTYMEEDNKIIEPNWYLPVIPMVLVNGAEGIGTGWSTNIPQYNPKDIVNNLRKLLRGEEMVPMVPWFKNWKGTIVQTARDRFKMYGRVEKISDTKLVISEIPAKTWTQNVKEFIENSLINVQSDKNCEKFIQNYSEQDDAEGHKFIIEMSAEQMKKTEKMCPYERFKIVSNINLSNMVLFNEKGKLQKFDEPTDIIKAYFNVRLEYYQNRKDYLCSKYREQLEQLSAKAEFIRMIIEKKLNINNRKRKELTAELDKLKFPRFNKNGSPVPREIKVEQDDDELDESEEEDTVKATLSSYFDYLLSMPLWSLTREKYEKLLKQRDEKEMELNVILGKSAKDLWIEDLDDFEKNYEVFIKEDAIKQSMIGVAHGKNGKPKKRARKKKDDDEDFDPTKKTKKRKKNVKEEEPELIVGTYWEPKPPSESKPKTLRVKKESKESSVLSSKSNSKSSSVEPKKDILQQLKESSTNVKVKKELSETLEDGDSSRESNKENPKDRMSSILGRAKTIFGDISDDAIEIIDEASDKSDKSEKHDDIFSKFSAAVNKFDTSFSVEDDEEDTKIATTKTTEATKAKPKVKTTTAAKPAKAKAAKVTKKVSKKVIDDDEDEDEDEESDIEMMDEVISQKPKPQRRTAAKKAKYNISSDEELSDSEPPTDDGDDSDYDEEF